MDEVLRLMSEVPGRELVVTANIGAYIRGPFNSFVAGPFEVEDWQPLTDDGALVESPDFCSVFVFNPQQQPPDFSNLNLAEAELRTGMSCCFDSISTAASVIERELTSGRCFLCVEKNPGGTLAVLGSVKNADTVAGPFQPSDYEFLQNSADYRWSQYDDTTWFVVSSKLGDQAPALKMEDII